MTFMIFMASGCAVAGRKITMSLTSFMNDTDIVWAIPGIIVALGVLFDAIFGKGYPDENTRLIETLTLTLYGSEASS